MTASTVFILPIPPSANNLFPTGKHGKRFPSPEYKAWLIEAGYRVPKVGHAGAVRVLYEFGRYPDRHRRDVMNREKAITDLLVKHGVIVDDHLIEEGTLRWSDGLPGGQVRVTVSDFMPSQLTD